MKELFDWGQAKYYMSLLFIITSCPNVTDLNFHKQLNTHKESPNYEGHRLEHHENL
jgi:hypothetical protein